MISRIHQKLGTASFIISIVALVAALGGGAYAASGSLTGKQKKEVEKIAKKYAGKPGKPGAPGAPGAAGPAGAKGDIGPKGDNGAAGSNGTNGTDGRDGSDGVGVTASTFAGAKGTCTEGGIEVKSASPAQLVCNGAKGTSGTSGFTSALPKGETETGNWAFGKTEETLIVAPISFAIPYSTTEEAPTPVYVKAGETGVAECPGTPKKPEAEEGYLCIYEEVANYGGDGAEPTPETNSAGGQIIVSAADAEERFGYGVWAVTGE